jgi:hypothetical protein
MGAVQAAMGCADALPAAVRGQEKNKSIPGVRVHSQAGSNLCLIKSIYD